VTGGPDMTGEPDGNTGGQRPGWLRRPRLLRSPLAIGGVALLGVAVLAAGVTASMRLTSSTGHPAASQSPSAASARLSNSAGKPAASGTPTTATASGAAAGGAAGGGSAGGGSAGGAASGGGRAGAGQAHEVTVKTAAAGPAAIVPALPTPPPRTACTSVVHIGDSTSEGLISADYEPNPANRIPARYADVGVKQSIMKIVGATSVVESLPGTPNAYDMASQVKKDGFNGCWVLALGTNDTADVYVGSNVNRVQRIQKMMSLIGNQPAMWVEVTSLLSTGPYSEQNMELWNQALHQVQSQYPNMRIYDWPAVAQRSWFINDGIHYTTIGYAHRATAIADALAKAFPAS
jgi:hypothetical protein